MSTTRPGTRTRVVRRIVSRMGATSEPRGIQEAGHVTCAASPAFHGTDGRNCVLRGVYGTQWASDLLSRFLPSHPDGRTKGATLAGRPAEQGLGMRSGHTPRRVEADGANLGLA
jgi:hypothetical protein